MSAGIDVLNAPQATSQVAPETTIAAGIMLVASSGSILFLKRGSDGDYPGFWAFPGGKREGGETIYEAAARETEEETGYRVKNEIGAPLCRRVKDGCDFTTYVSRVGAEFIPTLSDESTAYAWAPADQPPEPLHPGCAVALARAGMNELDIARAMAAGDLTSPQRYINMSLYDMRLTGTGLSYRIGLDEHVYRRPEVYLNQDFCDRCAGLPVIWVHPEKAVLDSKEYSKRSIGAVMLAYIKGDEVWAICRIYSDAAIELMEKDQLSTSPSVVFRTPSESTKIDLGDESNLLIEGAPDLLDHLAVVDRGVWDKGGDPTGIRADSQTSSGDKIMSDEKKPEDVKADASENIKDIIVGLADSVGKLCSRMDAYEKEHKADAARADAAKKDAEGKESESESESKEKETEAKEVAADKARKDAEDDAAADAKADAALNAANAKLADLEKKFLDLSSRVAKPVTDADYAAMSDAQARADSVFNALGKRSAPRPMDGENPLSYRRRLASALKAHSKEWKTFDISSLDETSFGVIEAKIYADAASYAAKPDDLGDNELRAIKKVSDTGHQITEFVGRTSFVAGMMPPNRVVRVRDPRELRQ